MNLRTPYSVLVFRSAPDGFYIYRGKAPDGRRIINFFSDHRISRFGRDAFHYLDELSRHESILKTHRRAYKEGLLSAFLITLLDELERSAEPVPQSCPPKIVEAERLARTHLGNPDLSVAMLASSVGCSPDYLSRLFHQERGLTLNRWIVSERIAMARELLKDQRYNVSEVGWACGFNSPSYFVRVFHQHTKLTPRAFRK